MIQYEIRQAGFSEPQTLPCKLSILLRMDSFAFMVTDAERRLQVLVEHALPDTALLHPEPAHDRLQEILEEEPLLHASYAGVRLGLVSPLNTLVPETLYEAGAERAYLEQLTRLEEGLRVRSEHLPPLGAWNVYAYPSRLLDLLQGAFPDALLCHHLSPLLHALYADQDQEDPADGLFLLLGNGYVQPIAFRQGALVYTNLFPFRHPQDVLYYLLLACRQIGREPEELGIQVLGTLTEGSALHAELSRLAPQLEPRPLPVRAPENPDGDPGRLAGFHDLFALETAYT